MMSSKPVSPDKSGKPAKIEDYQIHDAAETLMKAEEIKKNGPLMVHVHKHLKKKKAAINSIADLKAARDEMQEDESKD